MIHRAAMLLLVLAAVPLFAAEFDQKAAERFANLALACVHKEYPNKISHNLNSDKDVAPPRNLTPAFYGCFERPYGLAWLLQLGAELREMKDPLATTLAPLEAAASERLKTWLPKLSHP